MNKATKIAIVLVLVALIGGVFALKNKSKESATHAKTAATAKADSTSDKHAEPSTQPAALPHLIDLGANKCIPCKKMKPILADLQQNYADQFKITFIDVWENPEQKEQYSVKLIPTQIFYDASGEELFRHVGFYSKEDILNKWKELGIEVTAPAVVAESQPETVVK